MNAKNWTAVDQTLDDSFPASDPPAWNHGRQKTHDARKFEVAEEEPAVSPDKPKVTNKKPKSKDKPKRIRIGPSDVS